MSNIEEIVEIYNQLLPKTQEYFLTLLRVAKVSESAAIDECNLTLLRNPKVNKQKNKQAGEKTDCCCESPHQPKPVG